MRIEFVEIQNFRKLKSIHIDFASETTLFVGANNSGKTSAIIALRYFLKNRDAFVTNDFTLSNWREINKIGKKWEAQENSPGSPVPTLEDWEPLLPCLDLWLRVGDDEIHYVSHLLPTLDWVGGRLGVRLRLEPKKVADLYKEYLSAVRNAEETTKATSQDVAGPDRVALWPRTMHEFLERKIGSHLVVRAYTLDPNNCQLPTSDLACPQSLSKGIEPLEGDPLKGIIRIDTIDAQRDFADAPSGTDRLEDGRGRGRRRLSAQLQSYFNAHLDPTKSPEAWDLEALEAIQNAEKSFNAKLRTGFSNALQEVEGFGYPGGTDPKLTIATKIRLTDGLDHAAAVQYDVVPDGGAEGLGPLRLPEDYNGLGYQNLISMVFKLMGFRDEWMQVGKAAKTPSAETSEALSPPPLHLILIEEPEAHLHAQVQQVFINKAYKLLRHHTNLDKNSKLVTQVVVSTHSSHVAHECEFSSLRYFRRRPPLNPGDAPITTVVNMSEVFGDTTDTKRFVTRYLRATHCDLFFADAAILVEGPAERILVPQFLRNEFTELSKSYVTLLEIGGSHAHRLQRLIEHLGLITLIITDLDAMTPTGATVPPARGQLLLTRNATLNQWLPKKNLLDDLLDAKNDQKVKTYDNFSVRVAYQFPSQVKLRDQPSSIEAIPNTFEDALAYDNAQTFRDLKSNRAIGKFTDAMDEGKTTEAFGKSMLDILKKLKKAEFALDLLELTQEPWPIKAPTYIREGLSWLQEQLERKQEDRLVPSIRPAAEAGVAG